MTRSTMEQVWFDTPDRANLTSWRPGYIARFIRQIGTEYDFLFTEHSARFISNGRKHKHGMDWAVFTVQADELLIRFVRDRGDYEVLVKSPGNSDRWFRLEQLCVLIQLCLDEGTHAGEPVVGNAAVALAAEVGQWSQAAHVHENDL